MGLATRRTGPPGCCHQAACASDTHCQCSCVESAYLKLQVDSLGFLRVLLRELGLVLQILLLHGREHSIVDVKLDDLVFISSL
jgi:hypothetical protein